MTMLDLLFHHVGIGTEDFDGAIETYQRLGHSLYCRVDDPVLDVRIAFLTGPHGAGPWFEVLAPLGPDGPLKSLIRRRSLPAPYHTCYAVDDLEHAASDVRSAGFMAVGEPRPALAFDNQPVGFFFSRTIGLIELVERPPKRLASLADRARRDMR
jgi:methylmalonyl-CoA/ethylmalonyl-CoA epimerase